ncbi:class I SAM-dependent methyltransferase [uncultured Parabacteroides sp.]|uniref:class I SAM-dependent methyltransferase n=1 Tax=uncultured Parabacteroides sp. TaxID=512312 RepID=UPI0026114DFE|nr:class I SAM-dependent methyltransferase [uncultured Parabacteroides sp.]
MIKSLYRKLVSEKQRIALHYALYKIEALLLKGDRYECCCYGKSSRRFLSHGNLGLRKNIKCPHCLSLERTRILCMYIKNEVFSDANQQLRVLHFAPVKGLKDFLRNSSQVSDYRDADINPNVATYQVDITQIPYEDNSFDLIICSHILYCVPEDRKAMQEIHRVLRPGGRALIVDTIEGDATRELSHLPKKELQDVYGDEATCRVYGRDITDILGSYGLKARIIDYVKQLSPDFIEKECLSDAFDAEIIDCIKQ